MERRVSGKWRDLVSCSSFNSCSASSLREIRRAIFARANSVRPCINPTWETESFASPSFFFVASTNFLSKNFSIFREYFFFFCKRLEKKPRYLKDKREREREVSQGRDECTTIDVSQLSHDDEEREETLNGIRSRHAPSLGGASLSEIREPSN